MTKKDQRYVLFKGCLYQKLNPISLTDLPLPSGGEWVEIDEHCCGSNFHLMGAIDKARSHMSFNLRRLQQASAGTIVTPCPHCYTHLRQSYAAALPEVRIIHTVQLLAGIIPSQKRAALKNAGKITYHDPCLLGRLGGIYEEPRKLISLVFEDSCIREMRYNRLFAPCCGSGWKVNLGKHSRRLAKTIAEKRLKDAEKVDADLLITACPSCQKLFSAVKKEKRHRVAVEDINQIFLREMGDFL